jgi:hypothetical protein
MRSRDQYFNEWSEKSSIAWWNEGRSKLNIVIRLVNDWTLDGCPRDGVSRLLCRIDMGLQTFGAEDGGSCWAECLEGMLAYVTERSGGPSTR